MDECRSVSTPLKSNSKSSTETLSETNFDPASVPYQNVVGSLLYLVQATRPDLAHAVGEISQHNLDYDESHWAMVKRVLRYVQGSKNLRLRYTRDGGDTVSGYCDAIWARDHGDRRSISGYALWHKVVSFPGTADVNQQWPYQLLRQNICRSPQPLKREYGSVDLPVNSEL